MLNQKWRATVAGAIGGMLLLMGMVPAAMAQSGQPTAAATTAVVVPTFIEITLNITAINFGTLNPNTNSTRQALQMNVTDNSNVDVNFTFRGDTNLTSVSAGWNIYMNGTNASADPDVFGYNFTYDDTAELNTYGAYQMLFGSYNPTNQTGFFDRSLPAPGTNTSTDLHLWHHVPPQTRAGTDYSGGFTIRASRCTPGC